MTKEISIYKLNRIRDTAKNIKYTTAYAVQGDNSLKYVQYFVTGNHFMYCKIFKTDGNGTHSYCARVNLREVV